jgi:ketosteroid isomerase-like protein
VGYISFGNTRQSKTPKQYIDNKGLIYMQLRAAARSQGFLVFPILLLLITTSSARTGSAQSAESSRFDAQAVKDLLLHQQADWNRGDVTAFMRGYWNSPQLTFAGSTNFTRGWEPVLARYQHSYPDKAAMGHLDFSDLEIRPLGPDAALVLGRWRITKDTGETGGIFTLVLQRFPEGWRIVHDHTNADPQPKL